MAIVGRPCVGIDCVADLELGYDTIMLYESSAWLSFIDTSTSPGFPSNDGRLMATDVAIDGLDFFSTGDIDAATTPFPVAAGAP